MTSSAELSPTCTGLEMVARDGCRGGSGAGRVRDRSHARELALLRGAGGAGPLRGVPARGGESGAGEPAGAVAAAGRAAGVRVAAHLVGGRPDAARPGESAGRVP